MAINLKELTILKAHQSLANGNFSAVELMEAYLNEIAAKNKNINAYLEVFEDAMDSAKEADKNIKAGKGGVLTGIPCGIKDNFLIKGKIASSASKILEKYKATYDATAVSKLKQAGAVILGRTNMDEFAMGASTENSSFGITHNPYDLERVPGGTSGGSAAAVAMNGALFALGSDTGGSIRQPASFCGVVGLKPTYGAISRYGLTAMASSLDHVGPMTKTVSDCEAVFNVIKGQDKKDGTSISDKTYEKKTIGENKPIIGIPKHFLGGEGIDPSVLKAFYSSIENFSSKGYEVKEITLPNISYSIAAYYIIVPAEVSANMARFDGMRYGLHLDGKDGIDDYFKTRRAGFGREVIRRILLGTYVLSAGYYDAYYNRANAVRRMVASDFSEAFKSVDIIATPTTPGPAFKIGEKVNDPVAMYLEDIFTCPANLTGLPAMSIPCGFVKKDDKNLPIGLQLTARHGNEETLFKAGKEFLGEQSF